MNDESRLTYIGHATVLIEQADKRVLTDPALGRMLEGKLWRLSAMPTRRMYQDIDLVLISHLHHDHCDVASLRKVGTDVTILVPAGGGQWLTNQGFSHVIEVSYGDVYVDDGLTVRAVPASHSGRRRGGPIGVALGYIVSGGGSSLYFAGDTDLFDGMSTFAGDLDVALLPVWGWGPNIGPGHLDPAHGSPCPSIGGPSCRWASHRSIDAGSRQRDRSSLSTYAVSACRLRSPSRSRVTW
jgi:L-ascorbate metabolism protein UlaG (beta-lactamase superfamily)